MIELDPLVDAFSERAARLNVRVHRLSPDALGETVVTIAGGAGAASLAVSSSVPGRAALIDTATKAGIRALSPEDLWIDRRADVGVSLAQMAVAETGSLVCHASSVDRRVELCVDVHLIVVALDNLRPSMDDAMRLIGQIAAMPPSYVSLITGPSRTADIEMVPSIGVHGAREIHVLMVGAS